MKKKRTDTIKMGPKFNFKAVKSGDGETVIIEGFANKAVIDRGGDIIDPDAFDLTNFEKNPIMFFNHDPMLEIGAVTEIQKTDEGLKIKGMISNSDDDFTKRVRNNIKQGILRSFSVGFDPRDEEVNKDGINVIKAAELMEVSVVGIPMNQDSTFTLSKGADQNAKRKWACKMLDAIETEHKQMDEDEENTEDEDDKEDKIMLQGETGSAEDGHKHQVKYENSTGAGTAGTVIGEIDAHTHEIEDGKVLPGGIDDHTHTLEVDSLKEPDQTTEVEDEDTTDKADEDVEAEVKMTLLSLVFNKDAYDEDKAVAWAKEHDFEGGQFVEHDETVELLMRERSDFNEDSLETLEVGSGVNAVMGVLLEAADDADEDEDEDGQKSFSEDLVNRLYSQIDKTTNEHSLDEIVMTNVEVVSKYNPKPINRKHYKFYFAIIDQLFILKKAVLEKQAGQEQVENVPTTPVNTDVKNGELESPFLDAAKQTNVLLGAMISEMQQLRKEVAQLQIKDDTVDESKEEKPEETPEDNDDDKEDAEEKLLTAGKEDTIESEAGLAKRSLHNLGRKYIDKLNLRLGKLGV